MDSVKKKLAIIGASGFQNPLILKAKNMGIETHVFAWQCGDIGEETADFFYPISIVDHDDILAKCKETGIDGIATIGSDLANKAVAYVAESMGLSGNPVSVVDRTTDKHAMRKAFEEHGDPSPRSIPVDASTDLSMLDLDYPIIVKPTDRSGSRGITKLEASEGLADAVADAIEVSFSKSALIEEFAEGREFSVEGISWNGKHVILAVTEKFTTGAPGFIETGHLEPARISADERIKIESVVCDALMHLGVQCGASHSEIKMDDAGNVKIIEIGSRMGGDHIGSDLVELSTGYDFLEAVIDAALGQEPKPFDSPMENVAAIRFIFSKEDIAVLERMQNAAPQLVRYVSPIDEPNHEITDSSTRFGYFIFASNKFDDVSDYLPDECG